MDVANIFLFTVPILVLAMQIAIVTILSIASISYIRGVKSKIISFIAKHKNLLSAIVAISATLGSLFFSKFLGYPPCELCWYQRICMYPLAIIFGIAAWKKRDVFIFTLPLIIIGAAFSVYHYSVQFFSVEAFCAVGQVSCATKGNVAFGYITIPMMAFTAFAGMFVVQMLGISKNNSIKNNRAKNAKKKR